jgi:hypothetical protein
MKKIMAISLLFTSIFTLSACSPIDSGFITKKSYSAPWQSTEYDCISRDPKTSNCTVQMPRTVHHSASWKFDLKKNDKTGWVSVNEGDYNKYKVGDCWAC